MPYPLSAVLPSKTVRPPVSYLYRIRRVHLLSVAVQAYIYAETDGLLTEAAFAAELAAAGIGSDAPDECPSSVQSGSVTPAVKLLGFEDVPSVEDALTKVPPRRARGGGGQASGVWQGAAGSCC